LILLETGRNKTFIAGYGLYRFVLNYCKSFYRIICFPYTGTGIFIACRHDLRLQIYAFAGSHGAVILLTSQGSWQSMFPAVSKEFRISAFLN